MKIVAVVLAAGKSTRMGKNKLLLELGGKRMIDRILDTLEASEVDEIIVVLGSNFREVADLIKPRQGRITIAVNERYEGGMTSSLQIGLKQIKNVDAALLVLGDQPIFNPKFINIIISSIIWTIRRHIGIPQVERFWSKPMGRWMPSLPAWELVAPRLAWPRP